MPGQKLQAVYVDIVVPQDAQAGLDEPGTVTVRPPMARRAAAGGAGLPGDRSRRN